MNKKYTFLLALFTTVILYSCKKIPGHEIQPGSGSGSTSGGSTTGTYSPVTTGTYWTYKAVVGTSVDTTTNTMSGNTTTINGKLYSVVNVTAVKAGNSTGYFSTVNHVYTLATPIPGTTLILETQYLIDNAAVGTTWSTSPTVSGTINGVPAKILGKITEVGISKTVTGIAFNNVIHTTIQLQYDYGTGYQTSATYEYYVAQNIGVIEIDSTVGYPGSPSLTGSTTILAYKIK